MAHRSTTLTAWRTRIQQCDPRTVCYWAVSVELQRRVLPAFAVGSKDCQGFARELARPLVDQALAKLTRLYPDDAPRGVTALIRARKDAAYAVCAEAVEWAATLYAADVLAHPDDGLARRAQRIFVVVNNSPLPSWQGKSADRVSELGEYRLLFAYEDWMAAISHEFPAREWAQTSDIRPEWRERTLADAQATGKLPWIVPPEVLDAAAKAPTREAAALLILHRTAPLARRLSPDSLKRRLTRARRRLVARLAR